MLMDWEWFGCDLLNVWCKTETTFPALVGSDVWKMSFIFLRVGVELEGGCSSVGAGRSLFVRLGGLTPGSSCSQVKMFLRNKIHRNCFPNVSCFGSKHLLKWVCCKGWAHPHNKKHIQPNSLFYCYLHLNCRNTFGKYMFLQKTGLCETLLFFSFSFQFSIVTKLTWVRNRYIIPYLGSKHPSWSSKYQVFVHKHERFADMSVYHLSLCHSRFSSSYQPVICPQIRVSNLQWVTVCFLQ